MELRQLLIFVGIVIILLGIKAFLGLGKKRVPILFTCSTFFDFKTGDRWTRFCNAMDSLRRHHSHETLAKIDKWIVINEYSPNPIDDWSSKIKNRYPNIHFYQKGATEKGQARSMNIILEEVKMADLWIHWEEAWSTRTPFLDDAIRYMEENRELTQLQFTLHEGQVNWLDVSPERIHCDGRLCKIDPAGDTDESIKQSPHKLTKANFDSWPLYSLLPSINRASHYTNLGHFSEDPKLWPIRFEWDYARRWYTAGGKKAVLKDGPVWRPGQHISTYAKNV